MPHATIELHENRPHEHIEDSEHETVAQEMASFGAHKNVRYINGGQVRLIRGCYFGETLNAHEVEIAVMRLRQRLNRPVSAVFSDGPSYGIGLQPIQIAVPVPQAFSNLEALAALPLKAPVPPMRLGERLLAPRKPGVAPPPTILKSLLDIKKTG